FELFSRQPFRPFRPRRRLLLRLLDLRFHFTSLCCFTHCHPTVPRTKFPTNAMQTSANVPLAKDTVHVSKSSRCNKFNFALCDYAGTNGYIADTNVGAIHFAHAALGGTRGVQSAGQFTCGSG